MKGAIFKYWFSPLITGITRFVVTLNLRDNSRRLTFKSFQTRAMPRVRGTTVVIIQFHCHAFMQVLSDPVSHSGIQSDNQTDTHLHQQHFLFPRGFSFSQCACEVGTFNNTGHHPVSLECRTFVGHLPSAKFPHQYIMARSEITPLFCISNPKKNVEKLDTSK